MVYTIHNNTMVISQ